MAGYDSGLRIAEDEVALKFRDREARVLDLLKSRDVNALEEAEKELRSLIPPVQLALMQEAKETFNRADQKLWQMPLSFWLTELAAIMAGFGLLNLLVGAWLAPWALYLLPVIVLIHIFWPVATGSSSLLDLAKNREKTGGKRKDHLEYLAEDRYRTLLVAAVTKLVQRVHGVEAAEEIMRQVRETMVQNGRSADMKILGKLASSNEAVRKEAVDYLLAHQSADSRIQLNAEARAIRQSDFPLNLHR